MKYYTYVCPYLRCQIEYIFTLNRCKNMFEVGKTRKAGSESRQTIVIYSLI